MTGLIIPGSSLRCIRGAPCLCGGTKVTEGAIYLCEALEFGGAIHDFLCQTPGCDGYMVLVRGKRCPLCACLFAPLNDGDTSLVADEDKAPDEKLRGPEIVLMWIYDLEDA